MNTTMLVAGVLLLATHTSPLRGEELPVTSAGGVYAFGVRLEPPFEFTGVGSDTLRVNGQAYEPTPARLDAAAARRAAMKMDRETAEARYALIEKARHILKQGPDGDESAISAVEFLGQSELVSSVHLESDEVYVKFAGDAFETVLLTQALNSRGVGGVGRPVTVKDRHEKAIAMFRQTIARGSWVVFGAGYSMTVPGFRWEAESGLIERVELGGAEALLSAERPPFYCRVFAEDLVMAGGRDR